MSKENLSYEDLLKIIDLIESASRFSEFHLKVGDIEIYLKKRTNGAAPAAPPQPTGVEPYQGGEVSNDVVLPPEELTPAPGSDLPATAIVVKAPMVGTFYRASEPGAKPFVEIGSRVTPETTVCLIEVMKLINSIPAGATGVVTDILVENEAPVELGQPLIVIDSGG